MKCIVWEEGRVVVGEGELFQLIENVPVPFLSDLWLLTLLLTLLWPEGNYILGDPGVDCGPLWYKTTDDH